MPFQMVSLRLNNAVKSPCCFLLALKAVSGILAVYMYFLFIIFCGREDLCTFWKICFSKSMMSTLKFVVFFFTWNKVQIYKTM